MAQCRCGHDKSDHDGIVSGIQGACAYCACNSYDPDDGQDEEPEVVFD